MFDLFYFMIHMFYFGLLDALCITCLYFVWHLVFSGEVVTISIDLLQFTMRIKQFKRVWPTLVHHLLTSQWQFRMMKHVLVWPLGVSSRVALTPNCVLTFCCTGSPGHLAIVLCFKREYWEYVVSSRNSADHVVRHAERLRICYRASNNNLFGIYNFNLLFVVPEIGDHSVFQLVNTLKICCFTNSAEHVVRHA